MADLFVKPRVEKYNIPLNERAARFAAEYIVDLNATQAAIRAGYSARSAHAQGAKLLRDSRVAAAVQAAKDARAKRTEVSADRVLEEYARIAYQDHRMFYNSDGSLKKISELDDVAAAVLSGSEVAEVFQGDDTDPVRVITSKIKTWSKDRALEALGRNLGLFDKDKSRQPVVNIFPPEINKPADSGQ